MREKENKTPFIFVLFCLLFFSWYKKPGQSWSFGKQTNQPKTGGSGIGSWLVTIYPNNVVIEVVLFFTQNGQLLPSVYFIINTHVLYQVMMKNMIWMKYENMSKNMIIGKGILRHIKNFV